MLHHTLGREWEAELGVFDTLVGCLHKFMLMVGLSCPDCVALFAEMRSAITEAKSIAQDAAALSRAGNLPIEGVNEWWQISERWESARLRWSEASTDYKNHLAKHPCTPTSAKSMAKV